MPEVKWVFFDIGNVLLFFDHEKALANLAHLTNAGVATLRSMFLTDTFFDDFERGAVDKAKFFAMVRSLNPEAKDAEIVEAASDIFVVNQPMVKLLDGLKKSGVSLGLLSNTNEVHVEYMRSHYHFHDTVDVPIYSHEVGARKPERPIFEAALKGAGCSSDECLYFDDIPEYTAMARNLGLQSITYTYKDHGAFVEELRTKAPKVAACL